MTRTNMQFSNELAPISISDDPKTLVSSDWLKKHIKDPNLRIIDASWHMPASKRKAKAEYQAEHIPGARFFDIDEISNNASSLPHMAPSPEKFISKMRAMGIGDGHQVIVYDTIGLFSAARVWWLFKLMGKNDVAVLDGGLPRWKAEGGEISNLAPSIKDRHMTVSYQADLIKCVTQVAQASKLKKAEILDARAADRFSGQIAEPRAGLRSGHIPGAKNIPFQMLFNKDGTMKLPKDLYTIFQKAGVHLDMPIITSCGSGITAAIINLALERIGQRNHSLYDGSWVEWGMYDDLKIETGH